MRVPLNKLVRKRGKPGPCEPVNAKSAQAKNEMVPVTFLCRSEDISKQDIIAITGPCPPGEIAQLTCRHSMRTSAQPYDPKARPGRNSS